MHGATDWAAHFRWALCHAARVPAFPGSALSAKERRHFTPSRCNTGDCSPSADVRPRLRCPALACSPRSCSLCRRSATWRDSCVDHVARQRPSNRQVSRGARRHPLPPLLPSSQVSRTLSGWRFCENEPSPKPHNLPAWQRPTFVAAPRADLADPSLCNASAAQVVRSCAAGFAKPGAELII